MGLIVPEVTIIKLFELLILHNTQVFSDHSL